MSVHESNTAPSLTRIFPSTMLFWCDGCEEFKTLPAWSKDCPDCSTELQDSDCEYFSHLTGRSCGERATHVTTFMVSPGVPAAKG